MKGKRCRACETAITKPEHAGQAKATSPDEAAIREGKPKSKSKPLEPWPYKDEPETGSGIVTLYRLGQLAVVGLTVLAAVILLTPACLQVRDAARRAETINHMKVIGFACHSYHDLHKELPPSHLVSDKNGKRSTIPLSWRVAILPHINLANPRGDFDLTVGWDHENNAPLQSRMPFFFTSPYHGDIDPIRKTHFQYFTGPNTMFTHPDRGSQLWKIPDGSSNTIMFAEADQAVIWTQPADMAIRPGVALPVPPKEFLAVQCDGTVRVIYGKRTSDEMLRQLIDPNDGEPKGNWE
jgi:hypothetical protein